MPRRSPILAWIACLSLGTVSAAGQAPGAPQRGKISFGAWIGTSVFSGAARGTGDGGEQLLFIPYRPTMYGMSVAYGRTALRFEATVRAGSAGLAVRGGELSDVDQNSLLIVIENALRVRAISAGASARLGRLRDGPALRASAAVLVERWTSPDGPARTVPGAQAGLGLEVALSSRLSAEAEALLGLTPASPFRAEDLPDGFRQSRTWRRSLGVGVRWRL
jgi:hypothetical protein